MQDNRQEIREPKRNHKTEHIVKQVIENIKEKGMKLYTDKENERSMAVIPRLFFPSSSKNLFSFPSSYDSSLKLQALLHLYLNKTSPSPLFLSSIASHYRLHYCSTQQVWHLWPLAWPPMFLVSSDAVSSQQKKGPPTHSS